MRKRRAKLKKRKACYHLCCRTVDRDFKFKPEDRRHMRDLLFKVAGFSCVKLLNYAFLSNHYHFYVTVAVRPEELSEAFIRKRIEKLYEGKALQEIYDR